MSKRERERAQLCGKTADVEGLDSRDGERERERGERREQRNKESPESAAVFSLGNWVGLLCPSLSRSLSLVLAPFLPQALGSKRGGIVKKAKRRQNSRKVFHLTAAHFSAYTLRKKRL